MVRAATKIWRRLSAASTDTGTADAPEGLKALPTEEPLITCPVSGSIAGADPPPTPVPVPDCPPAPPAALFVPPTPPPPTPPPPPAPPPAPAAPGTAPPAPTPPLLLVGVAARAPPVPVAHCCGAPFNRTELVAALPRPPGYRRPARLSGCCNGPGCCDRVSWLSQGSG